MVEEKSEIEKMFERESAVSVWIMAMLFLLLGFGLVGGTLLLLAVME